jgi:hypothetical protein
VANDTEPERHLYAVTQVSTTTYYVWADSPAGAIGWVRRNENDPFAEGFCTSVNRDFTVNKVKVVQYEPV